MRRPWLLAPPPFAQSDFIDPSKGPPQEGDFSVDPAAFIALVIAGFVIGALGHLFKSRVMVATGVLMIFLATFAIPVFLAISR